MSNKDKRKKFDGVEVIKPILVIKFGLIFDSYKYDQLGKLWNECEDAILEKMPTFNAEEFFHQEEIKDGDIWYSFRYYTPKSNIKNPKESTND